MSKYTLHISSSVIVVLKVIFAVILTLFSFLPPLTLLLICIMVGKSIETPNWLVFIVSFIVGPICAVISWDLFFEKNIVAIWRSIHWRTDGSNK